MRESALPDLLKIFKAVGHCLMAAVHLVLGVRRVHFAEDKRQCIIDLGAGTIQFIESRTHFSVAAPASKGDVDDSS
jgi:hypothetical protein